jgi:hypothetical protein
LDQARTVTEGKALQVKEKAQQPGQLREAELQRGRDLYLATQVKLNGCITFLRDGLARRFDKADDAAEVEKQLREADRHVQEFRAWADEVLRPEGIGAADPFAGLWQLLSDLTKVVKEVDDQAINQMRDDLEKCRLRDWSELHP